MLVSIYSHIVDALKIFIELINEHREQAGARFFLTIYYSFTHRVLTGDYYVQEPGHTLENKPKKLRSWRLHSNRKREKIKERMETCSMVISARGKAKSRKGMGTSEGQGAIPHRAITAGLFNRATSEQRPRRGVAEAMPEEVTCQVRMVVSTMSLRPESTQCL